MVARPPGSRTATTPTEWVAVNSCLVPVGALDGQEVVTVEGLGTPEQLHPVQQELADRGGSQCGYCTPGFVCSMAAEFYRAGARAAADAPEHDGHTRTRGPNGFDLHALSGNLCRCTGYRPIRDAAFALGLPGGVRPARGAAPAARPTPARHTRLVGRRCRARAPGRPRARRCGSSPSSPTRCCSPAPPTSVSTSTSRAPARRCSSPSTGCPSCATSRSTTTRSGSARRLTLTEVERGLDGRVPLLAAAVPAVRLAAHPQRRHPRRQPRHGLADRRRRARAARARRVARARPDPTASGSSPWPTTSPATARACAAPASSSARSGSRCRWPGLGAFHKVAKRRVDDISSVAVAFALDVVDGTVARARIGLGGVAPTPDPRAAHRGGARGRRRGPPDGIEAAASVLAAEGTPLSDHRASARYRSAMLGQSLLRLHAASVTRRAGRRREPPVRATRRRRRRAARCRTSPRPCTSRVGRSTPTTCTRGPRTCCTRGRSRHRTRMRRVTGTAGAAGIRRAGGGARAHGAGRARHQRRRDQARRAALPERGVLPRPRGLLGARREPRGRAPGCARRRGRLRAAPVDPHAGRGDRGRELPGCPADRPARGRTGGARARRPTSSTARSRWRGRSTSTSRRTPRWRRVEDDGRVFVESSTQHPTETQEIVAHVLGLSSNEVTVQCLRMGGGFGGKEMQPHGYAAVAALGATPHRAAGPVAAQPDPGPHDVGQAPRVPRAVARRLRRRGTPAGARGDADVRRRMEPGPVGAGARPGPVPRRQRLLDPRHPGHRPGRPHPQDVADRLPRLRRTAGDARHRGHPRPVRTRCSASSRTSCAAATSTRTARPRPTARSSRRPTACSAPGTQVAADGDLRRRRAEIERVQRDPRARQAGGRRHAGEVRDLLQPHRLQPGRCPRARLQGRVGPRQPRRHRDGSGAPHEDAAGRGDDAGCAARARPARADPHGQGAQHLGHRGIVGRRPQRRCGQGRVRADPRPARRRWRPSGSRCRRRTCASSTASCRRLGTDETLSWAELVHSAYFARTQLFAAGYYRTEGLHWDSSVMQGSPFKYFAHGVAATEVEVDGFTGAHRTRRVDIVHDVGDSLSPLVDVGQIEGGFVQGAGWLTLEDLRWDTGDGRYRGRLATASASTYKLPSIADMPEVLNVALLTRAHEEGAVYGSKAVGEPPLMLAFSVREALRQACAAFGHRGHERRPRRARRHRRRCSGRCRRRARARGPTRRGRRRAPGRRRRRPTRRARSGAPSPRPPSQHLVGDLSRALAACGRARCARRREPGVLVTADVGARTRSARGGGQDGRRPDADVGHDRWRQPRGGRGRARPRDARRGATGARGVHVVAVGQGAVPARRCSAAGVRSACCSSRSRWHRSSRSSGWATSGHELARILARHDLDLHLVDSRPEALHEEALAPWPTPMPGCTSTRCPVLPELVLGELPPGDARPRHDPRPRRGRGDPRRGPAHRGARLHRAHRLECQVGAAEAPAPRPRGASPRATSPGSPRRSGSRSSPARSRRPSRWASPPTCSSGSRPASPGPARRGREPGRREKYSVCLRFVQGLGLQ